MLARSKLNSTENKISEALTNNEISHEDFTAIINYKLNESIRMVESQRGDTEKKKNLIEEGKKLVSIKLLNSTKSLIIY